MGEEWWIMGDSSYPWLPNLVICYNLLLKIAIEIVSSWIKNGDFHEYVSLPEITPRLKRTFNIEATKDTLLMGYDVVN